MNMIKKNGGFTLVELIVVIAILAILAGVAVPAYTGYIAKAQQAADMQVLSNVNTAAQGIAVAEGAKVTGITVTDATTISVTTDKDAGDTPVVTGAEVLALTDTLSFTEDFNGATWAIDSTTNTGKWTARYN